MKRTQKPTFEVKVGAILGSAWKNETADGLYYYTISLTRLHKDQQNRWQRSNSFRHNDLSALGNVVTQLQAECDHRAPRLQSHPGALSATIWPNDGPNGPYFTGTITRFYKDETGQRRLAKTFRPQDLPVITDLVADLKQKMTLLVSDPEALWPPKYDPRGELPEEDPDIDIFSEAEFEEPLPVA